MAKANEFVVELGKIRAFFSEHIVAKFKPLNVSVILNAITFYHQPHCANTVRINIFTKTQSRL